MIRSAALFNRHLTVDHLKITHKHDRECGVISEPLKPSQDTIYEPHVPPEHLRFIRVGMRISENVGLY